MSNLEQIADAGNTLVPAILTLRALGFTVTREERDDGDWWLAQADNLELRASDPLKLLGLAELRRARGSKWKATDSKIDEILREYTLDGDAG